MASARLESLHAQLGSLLENAQSLLADSAPSSTSGHAYYGAGGQFGGSQRTATPAATPPAVYSFLNMQVRKECFRIGNIILKNYVRTYMFQEMNSLFDL